MMHALRSAGIRGLCRALVTRLDNKSVSWPSVLYSTEGVESPERSLRGRHLTLRRGRSRTRELRNDLDDASSINEHIASSKHEFTGHTSSSSTKPLTENVVAQNSDQDSTGASTWRQNRPPQRRAAAQYVEENARFADTLQRPRRKSVISQLRKTATSDELYTDVEFPSDNAEKLSIAEQRDPSKHAYRPEISPSDTSIILFPGQESQFVGMGAKLLEYPNVDELYKRASKILGFDLLEMCLHGPKDALSKTVNAQPAVLVTSLAAVQKLKYETPQVIESCISTTGFNVGEISALVFAGAMSFDDAVRLVKTRAAAMQSASNQIPGAMATIFFGADGKVKFACHAAKLYCKQELGMDDAVCEITAYLYPGCKILSGNEEALEFLEKNKFEFGIKRIKRLPLPGAFNTRLMHSAVPSMSRVLQSINISVPIVPVYSNVTGKHYASAVAINRRLVEQVWHPLRWEQTMHVLYGRPVGNEFPFTYEVGPGRQMGSILKLINSKAYGQYCNVDV